MTDDRLCLLQVHAHPDDEASKGAGTNPRYAAEGVHTAPATCTDDPEGFWMRLPEEVVREVFPWEEYLLARSVVDAPVPEGAFEDDLFSGLRAGASTRPG